MMFNEILKDQLLTNDCNNYLVLTPTGEIIEGFYHCMYERRKNSTNLYKKTDITLLNTEVINKNSEKTLFITIDL